MGKVSNSRVDCKGRQFFVAERFLSTESQVQPLLSNGPTALVHHELILRNHFEGSRFRPTLLVKKIGFSLVREIGFSLVWEIPL